MTASLPQPKSITLEQLGRLIALLDTGEAFGEIEGQRWSMAADDGGWTPEELETSVRWLNLNHDGYVKIAHVHKRVELLRSRLRLARMYCWQHPNAIGIVSARVGRPVDALAVERFWQDYRREWLNDGIADAVMATQTDTDWIRWAEAEYKNFRSEL